jgi:vitamin K-dependent gamma-carboxylase-like protein
MRPARVRTLDPMSRLREFWIGQADLAPVALFRIVYGIELFNWFWQLFPNLAAFFTDEGIMPRAELVSFFPDRFSLLTSMGVWWEVAIFWAACIAVAVMLTVGWHTRTACILAFIGVASFEWRDPLILDGSDIVFRLIPFWLALTACGDMWSVDAAMRRNRGDVITQRGFALPIRLLELQVGWIYLMTGLEKMAGTLWTNGTATFYALQLEHTFGRSWAYPVAANMIVVHLMSWGTLAVELFFLPLTMLGTRVTRLAAVLGALMLHFGIATLMNVGNFPVIMISTLILFLPAEWVRSFVGRVEAKIHPYLAPRLVAATAGATTEIAAPSHPRIASPRIGTIRSVRVLRIVASVALVGVTALAFSSAFPSWAAAYRPQGELARVLNFTSLDQRWDMFSPDPAQADGWMLAPATLADGGTYDLLTGGPVSTAPRWSDPLYTRWVKVFERIANVGYTDYRLEFGRSFCRLRNFHLSPGESALATFDLTYVERTIHAPGQAPTLQEYHIWSHQC